MATNLQEAVALEVLAQLARRRMSQVQLANAAGMAQAVVSRKMRGESPITLRDLDRWAKVLNVRVSLEFTPVADAASTITGGAE
jgi:transcriptional regulator with XRE-family HTH domain